MNVLVEYLPFIIPLIVIEYGLAIFAVVHILKHPYFRFGNKVMWILIVLLLQIIGPVIYFVFGRGEEQ